MGNGTELVATRVLGFFQGFIGSCVNRLRAIPLTGNGVTT